MRLDWQEENMKKMITSRKMWIKDEKHIRGLLKKSFQSDF